MLAQALSYAAELNHAFTSCLVHYFGGAHLEQLFGDVTAVLAHTNALATLNVEHGVKPFDGSFHKGWALATTPDAADNGIHLMQQGLANRQARDNAVHLHYFRSLLAEAQARVGNVDSAVALCILSELLSGGAFVSARRGYSCAPCQLDGARRAHRAYSG